MLKACNTAQTDERIQDWANLFEREAFGTRGKNRANLSIVVNEWFGWYSDYNRDVVSIESAKPKEKYKRGTPAPEIVGGKRK